MSISSHIKDGKGTSALACVTSRNQLVTAPLEFSKMYSAFAGVINTAFNIVPPLTDRQFVITDIILYANKSVGTGDATVTIYEANSPDTLTVDETVFQQEMVKQTSLALTGLNIIVTTGKWVNIKTDDNDIFVNMAGYYVDAV